MDEFINTHEPEKIANIKSDARKIHKIAINLLKKIYRKAVQICTISISATSAIVAYNSFLLSNSSLDLSIVASKRDFNYREASVLPFLSFEIRNDQLKLVIKNSGPGLAVLSEFSAKYKNLCYSNKTKEMDLREIFIGLYQEIAKDYMELINNNGIEIDQLSQKYTILPIETAVGPNQE